MSTGTRSAGAAHASTVDRDAATKHTTVDFVRKDADEQVVTGVVMVPWEVDRQGDYETPETIESFAADFADLYANESADGGIMHAAWPSDWMDLEANVIAGRDELPDAVADADLDDGTWVQQWRITDGGLWSLIDDEIFEGFSIGARDVEWRGPMEQSDLPEGVGVPDEFDEDDPVWELVDGITREVSTVDTPAVPDALVLDKDDAEKALQQYLGDRDGFIEEMQQRGHDEADAERVWDVMSRAVEVDGSDSPGKESLYERIGKAAAGVLPGVSAPESPDDAAGAETQTRPDTAKEGRTLSRANRDSAMAAIDANLDLLEDAGVDHGMTRFTDRESYAFDLSEHTARSWGGGGDGDDDDTDDEDDDSESESMTDTNDDGGDGSSKSGDGDGGDPFDDAPAWAKSLKDDIEQNSEQIKEVADGGDTEEEKDAFDDAPEWASALKEQVEANAQAVESIGKQAGFSQQVQGNGNADKNGEGDEPTLANALRKGGVQ